MSTNPEMLEYRIVEEGGLHQELYLLDGKCHRNDGPAAIVRNEDGVVIAEFWCRNGRLNRSNVTAAVYFDPESGAIEEERFCVEGQLCREDGPAIVRYRSHSRNVASASWWRDGEKLPMTLTHWLWLSEPGQRNSDDGA